MNSKHCKNKIIRGGFVVKEFQPYIAEFIATFALVFIGAGAVIINAATQGALGLVGVALAHGLVLMSMIYATGHISGAHVNPAVTVAMWVNRKIETKKAALYIASQLLGACAAGFFLLGLFPAGPAHLGVPDLGGGIDSFRGIAIEAVMTFFLVFTIFSVAVDKRAPAGVYGGAIGLVLTFDILFGGALTGGAMNPARAFGPALASGYWTNQLVYWIGPLLGAVVAALVWKYALSNENKKR
ncbi:aquaporin [Candidatus Micrarchaeota archaeon]|nr:aquaporin [Candidatus Micrarchaeota archaeon]